MPGQHARTALVRAAGAGFGWRCFVLVKLVWLQFSIERHQTMDLGRLPSGTEQENVRVPGKQGSRFFPPAQKTLLAQHRHHPIEHLRPVAQRGHCLQDALHFQWQGGNLSIGGFQC